MSSGGGGEVPGGKLIVMSDELVTGLSFRQCIGLFAWAKSTLLLLKLGDEKPKKGERRGKQVVVE